MSSSSEPSLESDDRGGRPAAGLAPDAPAAAASVAAGADPASASIVDHLPDVVVRYDRDGRILFVNDAVREAVGHPPAHYIGRLAVEVSPTSETATRFAAARAHVFATGETTTFEMQRTWMREPRWFEYRVMPERVVDGRVETVLAIGRDVTEAHVAAEALRASEARYRALVEASSQLVWRTGAQGESAEPAPGWQDLTGRPVGDHHHALRPFPWLADVHPDDREPTRAAWEAAVRAVTPYRARYRVGRADGGWRTVAAHGVPVRGADGAIEEWVGTITDVTDPVALAGALHESERRLATLLSNVPGMAYRMHDDAAWTAEFVSEGAFALTGYTPDDFVGSRRIDFDDVIVPDDRARVRDEVHAALDAGRPFVLTYRIQRADGQVRWVWEHGRVVPSGGTRDRMLEGYIIDVTDREEVRAALDAERGRLVEAQRLAHVGSWDSDRAAGTANWSDELYRIAGLTPDGTPMTAARMFEIVLPEDRAYVRDRLAEAVASGREVEYEHRIRRPDGAVRVVQTRARAVAGADGAAARLVGTTQDVTERRALEDQLRHAQKIEALGLLAGSVAHDFNNLLSAILGGAELARREAADGTSLAADLDDIRHAGLRAAELTRQLLAFSRKQVRRPRVLDVRDVVGAMRRLLRRLLPGDVRLDIVLGAEPAVVLADAGQLEQLVTNLVVNARDAVGAARTGARAGAAEHAHDAVTVAVGVRRVEDGSEYRRADDGAPLAAGAYVALEVRDTGVGIDAATRAQLFDPFFTTKPEGQGTGLGLAIAFGVVAQHAGAIRVESAPQVGATFTVLLPRAEGVPDAAPQGAPPAGGGSETVLLVEDEPLVRAMTARILERHGYRVIAAQDGTDAMRLWREHAGVIDVVLTDLRMPGMDGCALAEALRAERPSLPLVLMSGYAAGADESTLLMRERFLEKPFTADELLAQLRAALGGARPAGDAGGAER